MRVTYLCTDLQEHGRESGVGNLLDKVSDKLDGDDRTALDQLVYALVETGQLSSARLLDAELTEQYLQHGDSKHGLQILFYFS